MNQQMDDRYLPLKALAGYSGLSVRTLRGYLANRLRPLPHYRFGGRIVVKQSEFDAWAAQFRATEQPVALDALVDDVLGSMR
ncbi:MAG: helix-turn-helix domain-containing protein [Vicinamibacterales bacterium]